MGLLDAHAESLESSLSVMASMPPDPEPKPAKYSAWSAVPRGIAAAAVEAVGNVADVVSLYGQTAGAMGTNTLIPDTPAERAQRMAAFEKIKTEGLDTRPEESRPYYDAGKDLRPDPLTAGVAENVLFGLTKGLTKAIGAGVVAGPAAGAAAFGVSEGMVTAEDLADQGVDMVTRAQAGAAVGAINAAGMALPVAGQTLKQTAGLVVAGGPAAFMAQQQAVRSILESADYGKIAQQFDPLDTTGLALATLLPAGFATWAKAGAISAAMRRKPALAATPDDVDAAMVHNLTATRDAQDEVGPGAFVAEAEALKETAPEVSKPAAVAKDFSTETVGEKADAITAAAMARVDELVAQNPDMPVAIREDGAPVRLADEIEAIRRQVREGTDDTLGADDAPLLKVAAECALSMGALAG